MEILNIKYSLKKLCYSYKMLNKSESDGDPNMTCFMKKIKTFHSLILDVINTMLE